MIYCNIALVLHNYTLLAHSKFGFWLNRNWAYELETLGISASNISGMFVVKLFIYFNSKVKQFTYFLMLWWGERMRERTSVACAWLQFAHPPHTLASLRLKLKVKVLNVTWILYNEWLPILHKIVILLLYCCFGAAQNVCIAIKLKIWWNDKKNSGSNRSAYTIF